MDITWIMVADSSRARVFERQERKKHLREIEDFINPAGRFGGSDLRSDERGRFYGKGERNQAHSAKPEVYPVEHELTYSPAALPNISTRHATSIATPTCA